MKNLFFLGTYFLVSGLAIAGYKADFILTTEENISFKKSQLSSADINIKDLIIKLDNYPLTAKKTLKVKVSDLNNKNAITLKEVCNFLNSSNKKEAINSVWQGLIFTVGSEPGKKEDITIYWAPSRTNLFVNGESQNYIVSASQSGLPKELKNGNFKCTVKIDFLKKK